MECLETTMLVDLPRGDPKAIAKLEELEASEEVLATTPVNLVELYVGAYRSRNPDSKLEEIEDLAQWLEILEFDQETCQSCGRVIASLLAKGKPIGTMDVISGCIALAHGEKMITRNVEHCRRIPKLSLESY